MPFLLQMFAGSDVWDFIFFLFKINSLTQKTKHFHLWLVLLQARLVIAEYFHHLIVVLWPMRIVIGGHSPVVFGDISILQGYSHRGYWLASLILSAETWGLKEQGEQIAKTFLLGLSWGIKGMVWGGTSAVALCWAANGLAHLALQ